MAATNLKESIEAMRSSLRSIGDAIRGKSGNHDLLTIQEMPDAISQLGGDYLQGYENGHKAGKQEGYDEGYEVGKQEGYEAGKADSSADLQPLRNPASVENIHAGYDAYGLDLNVITGEARSYDEGYEEGNNAGYQEGHEAGKQEGYEVGKQEGYEAGKADVLPSLDNQAFSNNIHVGYAAYDDHGNVIDGSAKTYEEGVNFGTNAMKEFVTCVTIPADVSEIDNGLFSDFFNLTDVKFLGVINYIANAAFANCKSLALTSLPASLTRIERDAFYNCTSLESITFDGTPDSISYGAFNACINLLDIYVPWGPGEVDGEDVKWGAENATIHYNHVPEGSA